MENTLSSEWRENIESLKRYIGELQGKHKEIVEQSKELDEKLQGMEDEIASLLIVYQKALQNKKQEIERLKAEHTEVVQQADTAGKTRVVYTKEQKDRMAEVYKQTFRNKTKTIEILHQEGIDVSYRHLIRILQKRGFKSERKK